MTKEYSPATDYEIEALETRSLEGGTYRLPCSLKSIVARIRQDARTITSLNGLATALRETIKKQGDDIAGLQQRIYHLNMGVRSNTMREVARSPMPDAKGPETPKTADDSQETNASGIQDQIRLAVSAEVAKYITVTNGTVMRKLDNFGYLIDDIRWQLDGHSEDCDSVEHDEDGERYDCNCHVGVPDIKAPMSAREVAEKALERCGDLQSQLAILSRQVARLVGSTPAVQHTEPSVPVSVLKNIEMRHRGCWNSEGARHLHLCLTQAIVEADKDAK